MNKEVKTNELFDCTVPYLKKLFEESEYPWEMLAKIKEYAKRKERRMRSLFLAKA